MSRIGCSGACRRFRRWKRFPWCLNHSIRFHDAMVGIHPRACHGGQGSASITQLLTAIVGLSIPPKPFEPSVLDRGAL